MKKALLILSMTLFAVASINANEKYVKRMGETISEFSSSQSIEDYQNLANKFKVIANVETNEWLPLYYEAQCYIFMSFIDRTGADTKEEYLDVAETSIEKMLGMAPAEAEVYTLQAFYLTGRLVISPAERSQNTAPLIGAALGKALAMDPANPRAMYLKLSNEMGTTRYFGGDVAALCEQAGILLQRWDAYTPKSPIYPSWGKNQVEQMVASCTQ